jgi:hypothetical protein
MSSTDSQDFTCKDASDILSCDALKILAKKEAKQNNYMCGYSLASPTCEKYQQYADRGVEYELQANGIISKNICFNPSVMIKTGTWENQFELLTPNPIPHVIPQYDIFTRPR